MKPTFIRLGHANNSSSTHSIILVEDASKFSSDSTWDFGWGNFTLSSNADKQRYFLLTLCYNMDCERGEWESKLRGYISNNPKFLSVFSEFESIIEKNKR